MRSFIAVAILCVLASLLECQAKNLCTGNCQNGAGTLKLTNGDKLVGVFVKGKLEGSGKLIYADKATLEGQFRSGSIEGEGTYVDRVGNRFKGTFDQGRRAQGPVTVTYLNANVYEGRLNSKLEPEGIGVLTIASTGARYAGNFKGGWPEGEGLLVYSNGTYFDGEFQKGEPTKGVLQRVAGSKYEGEFFEGLADGYGVLTYNRGTGVGHWAPNTGHRAPDADGPLSYSGEFRRGMADGRGTYIYHDGKKYIGEFKDGRPIKGGGDFYKANGLKFTDWDYMDAVLGPILQDMYDGYWDYMASEEAEAEFQSNQQEQFRRQLEIQRGY